MEFVAYACKHLLLFGGKIEAFVAAHTAIPAFSGLACDGKDGNIGLFGLLFNRTVVERKLGILNASCVPVVVAYAFRAATQVGKVGHFLVKGGEFRRAGNSGCLETVYNIHAMVGINRA